MIPFGGGWLPVLGAFVGFFAGLLGIGGGAIMVPLLVLFDMQGLPRDQLLHLAVGTSMSPSCSPRSPASAPTSRAARYADPLCAT
jgi:uncharacterized membrane protein YfcA